MKELNTIFQNKDAVNITLKKVNAVILDEKSLDYYWSSTERNSISAWGLYMSNGFVTPLNKYIFGASVRAVVKY